MKTVRRAGEIKRPGLRFTFGISDKIPDESPKLQEPWIYPEHVWMTNLSLAVGCGKKRPSSMKDAKIS